MLTSNELDSSGLTSYGEKFLLAQANALLEFGEGSVMPGAGFGYMDLHGVVDLSMPRQVYIQARMIEIFGLADILKLSDSKHLVTHGLRALKNNFHDKEHGGFFSAITLQGVPIGENKLAYDHDFVILASATGLAMKDPLAQEIFSEATGIMDKYYWDEEFNMVRDQWDLSFKHLDSYRGINASMHAVESFTAAFDVTGDMRFHDRAVSIATRAINQFARSNNWFLPEHFSENWEILTEFNADNPADQFKPYGVTIGHLFEWSRLILQLQLQKQPHDPSLEWVIESAKGLYQTGKTHGWNVDGAPGFVYTIDWQGVPVVRSRMQWVAAEAVMAAYTLWKITGESEYLRDYDMWWAYIDEHVLDKQLGSWHHELDTNNQPSESMWPGKPDIYHSFNACIMPLLPLKSSFIASALSMRGK